MNNSSLSYSLYDFESYGYMKPIAHPVNGGIFVGANARSNSHWSNIPMIPDSDWQIEKGLYMGKHVPNSQFQYINHTRLGNNLALQSGLSYVDSSKYTIKCAVYEQSPCLCTDHCSCQKCIFNIT